MFIETDQTTETTRICQHGHVAPRRMIAEDFRELDLKVALRTAYHVEELVLMQTVAAHAHGGHGTFRGNRFPDTTEEDVAQALRLNPEAVRRDRQELIDEVRQYAVDAMDGKAGNYLLNPEGEPLLRIGTFRHLEVDPRGVLMGLYAGGLRDEPEIRAAANKRYGATLGYGLPYLVDKNIMHRMGYCADMLAREGHAHEIDLFKTAGMIVDKQGPDVAWLHICHQTGERASDDAAIVIAGKLWGYSAAIGCFLADAIDTLEKFSVRNSDEDAELADLIARDCPNLGLSKSDASKLAYLASIPEDLRHEVPDSTLRGLLEIDHHHDVCALECHLLFVNGQPTPDIELGHGEATTHEFYEYINARLSEQQL